MAKSRNPNRDEAKKMWLESGGSETTKEISAQTGVSERQIRRWKSADNWQGALSLRKSPGGQPGNTNAKGSGAPKDNKNAETHGAHTRVNLDDLTAEESTHIKSVTLDPKENMLIELKLLYAKELDLKRRIDEYRRSNADLYTDKVVETLTPKDKGLKTASKTVIKVNPFDRLMKLEAEYGRIHGRILKLIDTVKSYELDRERLELEHKKHELAKQRLTGVFDTEADGGADYFEIDL